MQLFDAGLWLLLPDKKQEREKNGWTILEEIKEHEGEEGKKMKVQQTEKSIISTSGVKLKENALK